MTWKDDYERAQERAVTRDIFIERQTQNLRKKGISLDFEQWRLIEDSMRTVFEAGQRLELLDEQAASLRISGRQAQ